MYLLYKYDGIFSTGDINIKALSHYWCAGAIIKYYIHDFEFVSEDVSIKEKFLKNDWNDFNNYQIIFNGNTMHLCLY